MIGNRKTIRFDFETAVQHVETYLKSTGECFATHAKPDDITAIAMKMIFGEIGKNRKMGVRKACEAQFGTKFVKTVTPNDMKLAA